MLCQSKPDFLKLLAVNDFLKPDAANERKKPTRIRSNRTPEATPTLLYLRNKTSNQNAKSKNRCKEKTDQQPLEKEPPPLLRHRSYIDFLPVVRSIAERDERQCHKTKQNKKTHTHKKVRETRAKPTNTTSKRHQNAPNFARIQKSRLLKCSFVSRWRNLTQKPREYEARIDGVAQEIHDTAFISPLADGLL